MKKELRVQTPNFLIALLFLSGCIAVITIIPTFAMADYIATGPIRGQECTSYIIFDSCKSRRIDAVEDDNGQPFTVKNNYSQVSDYKNGRCWIKTKSVGGGLLSWATNALKAPVFLEKKKDGSYEKLDIEYLVFPCKKSP